MSDVNKALSRPHGQQSKWEGFTNAKGKPNACIHCAFGTCSLTGTSEVKCKDGSKRTVTHKTGLTKAQFDTWLAAPKAPAKAAPAKAAPAAASTAPSTSGAKASTEMHALNDVPGFDLLSSGVKERISKDVNDKVGASQTYKKFTFWDDAAWAVVEPIALKMVNAELVKLSASRPHTGGGHPHHKAGGHPHPKAGGHPHHKGGKKGGH